MHDPFFADRLHQLSAVNLPEHFQSQSLSQNHPYARDNTLVNALASRAQVTASAVDNLNDANTKKTFLHPQTITAILEAREQQNESHEQIEADFGLEAGLIDKKLGPYLRRPSAKRAPSKTVVNQGAEARKVTRAMDMNADMDGELKQ